VGEDISKVKTNADAKKIAEKHGIDSKGVTKINLPDELLKIFREKIIQPTFLIDYPIELAPLAKPKRNDPTKAEIFQPIVGGLELARAYSELNDPRLQEEHFNEQEKEREVGNQEAMPTDKDFVTALKHGMPPACGVGIGIERLIMLFTNNTSIRDVILFPFMKPEKEEKK
jgi:lysyl-tRNA synthetase class 2